MSWNRTYRPTSVADLHLDFVRTQIQRMMDAGKIPQALLFAGPKGTGKTSTSRIIGAVVNDPKNESTVTSVYFKKEKPKKKLVEPDPSSEFNQKIFAGTSFVVQEMDAASNRGIDDIRQLKTRAYLPPQEGKMSVFILDEAHMLTTEAFNALLKLLEEPPEHVIFILATTELHKIPDTIISRCQLVEFRKATPREITNRLKSILISEKIEFEDEALAVIATNADGSFRDAVKLLELSSQSGKVTIAEVSAYTSAAVTVEVELLLKYLLNKDEKAVVELFETLREKNVEQQYFHKSLLTLIHTSLLQNLKIASGESVINKTVAQFLLQELSSSELSSASPIPHLRLELKILELIDRSKNKSGGTVKKNPEVSSKTAPDTSITHSTSSQSTPSQYEREFSAQVNREDTLSDTVSVQNSTQFLGDATLLKQKWSEFVETLAINNSTLAVLLRSAKLVSVQEHLAVIGVYYNFHQEQLSQQKALSIIQDCIKQIIGDYIELEFILLKTPDKAELIEPQKTDTLVNSALQALL
ncbi:MAG: DNA polymerase III subunit gamma/tau [Patescibacteria group bacterium]|nr:MAG: DNA polymerase III subunit gamma/tau [Patescibacteria group bacterium]